MDDLTAVADEREGKGARRDREEDGRSMSGRRTGLGKFNDTQHASRRKQVRRHNFLRWERGFHVTVPKPGAPKPKTSIKKFEKKKSK
jgi:hypothetical protein